MHPAADDEWLEDAAAIPLVDADLPDTVIVEGSAPTTFLGIARRRAFSATGILVRSAGNVSLLTANLPLEDSETGYRIPELQVRRPGSDDTVTLPPTPSSDEPTVLPGILLISFPSDSSISAPQRTDVLRSPAAPEECCVARTVFSEGQSSSVVHSIGRETLAIRDNQWLVTDSGHVDLSAWNGAPVISLRDGRVIGILMSTDYGTAIAPITDDLIH